MSIKQKNKEKDNSPMYVIIVLKCLLFLIGGIFDITRSMFCM